MEGCFSVRPVVDEKVNWVDPAGHGGEGWLAFDLEVAAQGRLCHIDVFELDFDMVSLYVGPLLADEFAEGPKEG